MQGFNMGRYVPPDQEGVLSGNQVHGKHALGARANKISQGILTVRFEMPFPIWCITCPKPTIIGQGVRFNAEKKKVGNYHSSHIYSFRMKHAACSGWIEIRTDPKNTAYVVTEGARKRDLGEDKVEEGDVKILTQDEREALRANAFASLEEKVEDKKRLEYGRKRLEELQELSEQHWEDPYQKNKQLRREFRKERKLRDKDSKMASALQDKMSLGIDLLPENEEDARRAKLVEFGEVDTNTTVDKTISKPLFATEDCPGKATRSPKLSKRRKAEDTFTKKKSDLVAEIRGNTRAAMDPFIITTGSHTGIPRATPKTILTGVKRKRSDLGTPPVFQGAGLVDYDSD